MKKFRFVFNILKRRVANIFLLAIMFSSLLLIFMVGLSIKDIFYDYIRSDYGNIPDMKIKLNDLNQTQMYSIQSDIKKLGNSIDILYGYEDIYTITIRDSEESLLASDMPVLIKGIHLKKSVDVEIDGREHSLDILEFNYVEGLHIELDLGNLKVQDKDSIKFLSKGKTLEFNFCTKTDVYENTLSITSHYCYDDVDLLFQKIEDKKSTHIEVRVNSKDLKLKIEEIDREYRTMVLDYRSDERLQEVELELENLLIDKKYIEQIEAYDNRLYITFKRSDNLEYNYKRYISQIIKNYMNYNRFVLKVKNYSFDKEEEQTDETVSKELVWLNELTDILDMINFNTTNSAIASEYMANDLNNFGILDNFTIATQYGDFVANIRSTIYYNPEQHYDNNILIFNNKVLQNEFEVGDKNNYIDVYVSSSESSKLEAMKKIVLRYDNRATFVYQEDIIPSIAPKKKMFDSVILIFTFFIFGILFIAMYVVLIQFYSNFESELALLKLFGSYQPYQAYINSISFAFASFITFIVLQKEESYINEIMQKYFFTSYDFDIDNYFISLGILALFVILISILEFINMKKLNIIKGQ